jgi:uncharacterized membrane protein HdeD (DUF308 family)
MTTDTLGTSYPLLTSMAQNWWLFLLRGIAAILFGVLALFWPGETLALLIIFFGFYAIIDGIIAISAAIAGPKGASTGKRWWLAVVGAAGVLAGLAAMFWPGMTAILLLLMIGCWSIVIGITQIVGAIQLRKVIGNEWALIASGALAVLFGAVVVVVPGAGALTLAMVIGAYAIVFGLLLIWFAFRVRSVARALGH